MDGKNSFQISRFRLGCFTLIAILIIAFWFIGEPRDNDAYFVEFNICLDNSIYDPVAKIPRDTNAIFVCGIIEGDGNGQLAGALFLYSDDQVIGHYHFGNYPGIFFQKIDVTSLIPGIYRFDILSAGRVVASTEFQIIDLPYTEPVE